MSDVNKAKEILENVTKNGRKEAIGEGIAFLIFAYGAEEGVRKLYGLGKKGFNKLFPKKEIEVSESEETVEVVEVTEEK